MRLDLSMRCDISLRHGAYRSIRLEYMSLPRLIASERGERNLEIQRGGRVVWDKRRIQSEGLQL